MVFLLGITCLGFAVLLIACAQQRQRYMRLFEQSGGMLFVSGLMLLGTLLPRFY